MSQARLFEVVPAGPEGFSYKPDFITQEEERTLLNEFKKVPLHTFKWDGYDSKRRVKSYTKESGYPATIARILERVAKFARVKAEHFEHAMVSEYTPGTQIGWHRDKGPYSKIIGISLGSPVEFRLRRLGPGKDKRRWERFTITAEPRSLYIMSGESRVFWQHSIPKVEKLRYSITMRTVEKRL